MDNYKIRQANKLYAKIQGALWAREKHCEYEHYDSAQNCTNAINECEKEIDNLKLTKEEQAQTGFGFVDNNLAEEYYDRFRC